MSLETASLLFDWSSIALAIGACIVFVATAAIVWLGIVKEHHWEMLREHANERIAAVGLEAAKANAELGTAQANITKANAKIAEANERAAALEYDTAQARLEQERLRAQLAWRRLTRFQANIITANARGVNLDAPLNITVPVGDVEAASFAVEIMRALRAGGLALNGEIAHAAIYMPVPPTGIVVKQPGTEQVPHPLAQAIANSGLHVTVEIGAPNLEMVVGTKPSQF